MTPHHLENESGQTAAIQPPIYHTSFLHIPQRPYPSPARHLLTRLAPLRPRSFLPLKLNDLHLQCRSHLPQRTLQITSPLYLTRIPPCRPCQMGTYLRPGPHVNLRLILHANQLSRHNLRCSLHTTTSSRVQCRRHHRLQMAPDTRSQWRC